MKTLPKRADAFPLNFASLDFETTGVGKNPNVTECSVGIFEDGIFKYDYTSYVYTRFRMPKRIRKLTKIEPDYLKHAPSFTEVVEHIVFLIDELPVVCHGAQTEIKVLERYKNLVEVNSSTKFYDTYVLAKQKHAAAGKFSLSALLEYFEIEREGEEHTARSDMLAVAALYLKLIGFGENENKM